MSEPWDVVVAGAGVGGAAFALALACEQPGLRVLLLEQHAGAGNLNRGDNLLPTVTAYLAAWGCLERLRAAGARDLFRMQVWAGGARLMEVPLARPGDAAPYLVLAHPEIERALVEAACAGGRVEVRWRSRLSGLLRERQGGVERVIGARVAGPGGAEQLGARLVVGADGSRSQVRAGLGIDLRRLVYAHGYYGIAMQRPTDYEDAMRVELSPRGGILVVPRLEPDLVGLGVLVHEREEPLFRSGPLEEKLAAIRARTRLFDGCQAHPEGAHLYRLSRAHAPRYVAPGCALLGDAIHVTNPVAGQGMTMAIEDAAALARRVGPALARATSAAEELDAALLAYQAERRPRNAAILRWSHWLSHAYAHPGRPAHWVRRRLFALGGTALGRRVHGAIYGRLAARTPLALAAAPRARELTATAPQAEAPAAVGLEAGSA